VALSRNTYTPEALKLTVVVGNDAFAKAAVPGPLIWLQVEVSGLGGVGLVSVTTPLSVADAGYTMTWSDPALTPRLPPPGAV
jgi:hypothetical protein